jgi:predicted CoA-substrate-specific enzyme activase
MKYVAGVDIGSTQAKGVILDEQARVVGEALLDMERNMSAAASLVLEQALANAGLEAQNIAFTVATGYGRYRVSFGDLQITEISCHARGALAEFPATHTVLDIGGQDTKAIRIGDSGEVVDFAMNDKCAAGTGRFLGAASFALELPLSELGHLAQQATAPVKITTTCTVFAESEIIGHLARGHRPEDVLMGMHQSIATRCSSLVRRVGLVPEITFTGGVSRNTAMVALLQDVLATSLNVSRRAQFMGAIGAGLYALDHVQAGKTSHSPGLTEEAPHGAGRRN